MNSNTVFPIFSEIEIQRIKEKLKQKFSLVSKPIKQGTQEAFEIDTPEGKINFIYYKKGKLMIQASPTNSIYVSIVNEINKTSSKLVEKKIEVKPKEESELISDYYVGCDEAGAGETFGSMFLGCVIIPKKNLEIIANVIRRKNIRQLTRIEINSIYSKILSLFKSEIKKYSAKEIDFGSKNLLLDKGYVELINKIIDDKSQLSIVVDDYGIKDEMKRFLNSLKTKGIEIITINKADEQYTACKIASLIARRTRLNEMENINKTNSFVDQTSNEIISPGSGAASNPDTARYLIEFRKKFPDSEFPEFVRKKWKNVMEVEAQFPRRK